MTNIRMLLLSFVPMVHALRAGHVRMNAEAARAKTAVKFEAMLNACILPPAAIELIDDKKQRALFRGVAAAAERDNVRNAFLIVYQDMGPVRVAGDLIFNRLQKVASVAESAGALDGLEESADTLAAARELPPAVDATAQPSVRKGAEGGGGHADAPPVRPAQRRPAVEAAAVAAVEGGDLGSRAG